MNEAFPDMSCYTIHSKQSKEKNEAQLAAFMQAPTACIISVNMLGEGVHVDGVNFIVMLRRTQSPTVYFQQIGRCTKVGSDGEPVIFDIVGNRCTLRMIEVKKAEFLGLSRRAGEKKGGQFVLSSYLEDGLRVLDEIDELLNQWRPWSVEEDEIIRKFYPSEGLETCSRLSNRTKNSVRDRACFLGIARSNYYWKKEEDDILRKYHPKEGTTVCSRLPGRTRNAIKARLRHHYGTYDVFGSQYAFLSKEEATAWLNANYPGAILVDRTQEVTGVLSFGDVQPDKFITIPCSIDRFADLFAGCLSTTSINVNGVFAIYDTSTQNDPFAENRFVARMGDDGTPAESVCGAYLLLRTKVNADGSRSLCSIDQPEQEIVADTVKEPSPAAQLFL